MSKRTRPFHRRDRARRQERTMYAGQLNMFTRAMGDMLGAVIRVAYWEDIVASHERELADFVERHPLP